MQKVYKDAKPERFHGLIESENNRLSDHPPKQLGHNINGGMIYMEIKVSRDMDKYDAMEKIDTELANGGNSIILSGAGGAITNAVSLIEIIKKKHPELGVPAITTRPDEFFGKRDNKMIKTVVLEATFSRVTPSGVPPASVPEAAAVPPQTPVTPAPAAPQGSA